MTFNVMGNTQSNLIITGIKGLQAQSYGSISIIVFFAAILAPILHFAGTAYLNIACLLRVSLPGLEKVNQWTELMQSWNLIPIFCVACVISALRLDMLGLVNWDIGAVFVVLLGICSMLVTYFHRPHITERILEEIK